MKRFLSVILILALLVVPGQAAFAQDFGGDMATPYDCDPFIALDNLTVTFSFITDFQSLSDALVYAGGYLLTCIGDWIPFFTNALIGMLSGQPMMPPFDEGMGMEMPQEGSSMGMGGVSPLDLELALQAIFAGDLETGNSYLCEDDQATEEEFTALGDFQLDSLSCYDDGDGLISCDVEATVGSGDSATTFSDTTTFEIVDGRFCSLD